MKLVENTAKLGVVDGTQTVIEVQLKVNEEELLNLLMIAKKALKDTESFDFVSPTFQELLSDYRQLHDELHTAYFTVQNVSIKARRKQDESTQK